MLRCRSLAVGAAGFLLASAASANPGDLDNDGSVTVNDARLALRIAAGFTKDNFTDETNGDVAGLSFGGATYPDGHIDILDAERILRAAKGLDDLGGGTTPPSNPALLDKTDAITISNGNLVRNYSLTQGFVLSGALTSNGLPVANSSLTFTPSGSTTVSYDTSSDYQGNYSVVLPAGTYAITGEAGVSSYNGGVYTSYSESVAVTPASVTVSADTTKNLAEAAPAAPGTVTGSITAPNFTAKRASVSGPKADGSGTVAGAAYMVQSGPGQVALSLGGVYTPDTSVNVNVSLAATFTVNSNATTTHNVTVPSLALVTGTITPPAGGTASGIGLLQLNGAGDTYTSFDSAPDNSTPLTAYKLAVPAGNYTAYITLNQTDPNPNLYYVTSYTMPAGGGTKNYTLPALPATFTFSGTVTDNVGAAVPFATVSANFNAFPNNAYGADNEAQTDDLGQFTMKLPNGTYSVTITPPAP